MAIYERFRNLREDRGWTQQEAQMLHVSRTSCCACENGVTGIGPGNLIHLSKSCRASAGDLTGPTDEQNPCSRKEKKK